MAAHRIIATVQVRYALPPVGYQMAHHAIAPSQSEQITVGMGGSFGVEIEDLPIGMGRQPLFYFENGFVFGAAIQTVHDNLGFAWEQEGQFFLGFLAAIGPDNEFTRRAQQPGPQEAADLFGNNGDCPRTAHRGVSVKNQAMVKDRQLHGVG